MRVQGSNLRVTMRPKCPPLVLTFRRKDGSPRTSWRWYFALDAGNLRQHWVADSWWYGWRKIQRNADQLRARWRRDHPPEVLAVGLDEFLAGGGIDG